MDEEKLRRFGEAWGRGDLDTLMTFIAEDCVYSASVGPEPGEAFRGREAVRAGFAEMLAHDADAEAKGGPVFVCGDRGTAEWSFVYAEGNRRVEVRGCDLFEFSGDLIKRKDAFRKVAS